MDLEFKFRSPQRWLPLSEPTALPLPGCSSCRAQAPGVVATARKWALGSGSPQSGAGMQTQVPRLQSALACHWGETAGRVHLMPEVGIVPIFQVVCGEIVLPEGSFVHSRGLRTSVLVLSGALATMTVTALLTVPAPPLPGWPAGARGSRDNTAQKAVTPAQPGGHKSPLWGREGRRAARGGYSSVPGSPRLCRALLHCGIRSPSPGGLCTA
ncbi:hypothetical protein J1605_009133 [Eschrichtius robustus]|uniref:Uncharacterized protein n=1 Tax=Eschrichtius robustus TaxID=9764 RepID=A0AB34GVM6_ESCRO|nr:hypothetical protein J1605_009133 [Eschrichtius robustus]